METVDSLVSATVRSPQRVVHFPDLYNYADKPAKLAFHTYRIQQVGLLSKFQNSPSMIRCYLSCT